MLAFTNLFMSFDSSLVNDLAFVLCSLLFTWALQRSITIVLSHKYVICNPYFLSTSMLLLSICTRLMYKVGFGVFKYSQHCSTNTSHSGITSRSPFKGNGAEKTYWRHLVKNISTIKLYSLISYKICSFYNVKYLHWYLKTQTVENDNIIPDMQI